MQEKTPEFIPGSGTTTRAQISQGLHFLPISIGAYGEINHDIPNADILELA